MEARRSHHQAVAPSVNFVIARFQIDEKHAAVFGGFGQFRLRIDDGDPADFEVNRTVFLLYGRLQPDLHTRFPAVIAGDVRQVIDIGHRRRHLALFRIHFHARQKHQKIERVEIGGLQGHAVDTVVARVNDPGMNRVQNRMLQSDHDVGARRHLQFITEFPAGHFEADVVAPHDTDNAAIHVVPFPVNRLHDLA